VTGVGTILADDPSLNVRSESYQYAKQPLRVILDSNLSTPPAAKTLSLPGDVLIITVSNDASKRDALEAAGASVVQVAADEGRVSLPAVLDLLSEKEINTVLLEAGAVLNGSFLQQGLTDELLVYQASHVMGSDAVGMFAMAPLSDMAKRVEFTLQDVCRIGKDLRLRYIVKNLVSED
jgi:diaminohydroxyphosphoribosylaminopyrimidine deaminase/5-amino-6-(5-phosphoribosylamino)uracil reductase